MSNSEGESGHFYVPVDSSIKSECLVGVDTQTGREVRYLVLSIKPDDFELLDRLRCSSVAGLMFKDAAPSTSVVPPLAHLFLPHDHAKDTVEETQEVVRDVIEDNFWTDD